MNTKSKKNKNIDILLQSQQVGSFDSLISKPNNQQSLDSNSQSLDSSSKSLDSSLDSNLQR